MSKQALQFAELFKQLPLSEQLQLLEMLLQEVKQQALKKNGAVAKKRLAGFNKAVFEMSEDFNAPVYDKF